MPSALHLLAWLQRTLALRARLRRLQGPLPGAVQAEILLLYGQVPRPAAGCAGIAGRVAARWAAAEQQRECGCAQQACCQPMPPLALPAPPSSSTETRGVAVDLWGPYNVVKVCGKWKGVGANRIQCSPPAT